MLKHILAERLRSLMKARPDLDTQVKVANAAGLSQSTVGRVLAGEVNTNLDVVESLSSAYRIHPLALLSDPSQMTQADAMAAGYQERQLLAAWRLLSPQQQHSVMGYLEVSTQRVLQTMELQTPCPSPDHLAKKASARKTPSTDRSS